MTAARRLATAALVLAALTSAARAATYGAFSRTTTVSANSFTAGTVNLGDNDAGAAMLSLSSAVPGNSDTGCVQITYTGSLAASVRLHGTVSGALAPYLTLTVTRGTDTSPAFRSCAAFAPDATNYIGAGQGIVYSGPLSNYPAGYTAGIVDPPSGPVETWTTDEAHSYRLSVTLTDNAAAAGTNASASFTWEARNL